MLCPTSANFKSTNYKGFTLVELLIVIGLIAVMAGFLVPNFSGYLDSQNIKQAQEQLKNDMRTVQNRALSGVDHTTGMLYWGIKFQDNTNRYFYFTSALADWATCNGTSSGENSVKLPGDTIVRNGTVCVFFSFDNGGAVYVRGGSISNQMITVGYASSSGTECHGVEINSAGLIKGVSNVSSCDIT